MNVSWQNLGHIALATATAGAFLVTALPDADAARRASLANNRLIEDKNDVYLFPQRSLEHTNLLSLEYGAAQGSGSGLFLMGDGSMAFGVGIYRGDLLDANLYPYDLGHPNLGQISNPLPGAPQPFTILDLFGGFDLGAGSVGVRLAFGSGGDTAVDIFDELTADTQNFVAATIGFSMDGDLRLDTGLNIIYSSNSVIDSDVNISDFNTFGLGATVRGYSALANELELGFLADLFFVSAGALFYAEDADDDVRLRGSAFGLFGGVGPVFTIDEESVIAGYAVLGHTRSTAPYDIDDEDELRSFARSTILPGLHVAADIQLLDWLYFRTGAQYHYGFETSAQEVDNEGVENANNDLPRSTDRFNGFGWRAGLGIQVNNFTLDGAFQAGFLTNGPDFLGGNGNGMFTSVAAGYTW